MSKVGLLIYLITVCYAGQVVCLLHNEMDVRWGAKFDETVRQVWAMMEEYVKVRCGKDCTNLRSASCFGVISLLVSCHFLATDQPIQTDLSGLILPTLIRYLPVQ